MGLENPIYLDEFITGNPGSQDQRHEGDDHLRNLKVALKNTFPGLAGRSWRKRSISVSGPINLTDNMTLLNVSGGLTVTPAAASVLGNGWMAYVRANGGSVTINPGDPINGAGQIVVPVGYSALIFSDGVEFFAMLMYQDVPPSVKAFPTGTKMVFNQTTAPIGWTKQVSGIYDNTAIRVTTGTVGSGGADNFTSVFAVGRNTSGHVLSSGEMPSHTHTETRSAQNDGTNVSQGGPYQGVGHGGLATVSSGAAGGSGSHLHGMPTMNIKYNDVIVASID